MRYLLAAEADKIQDFVFRSSRLREVVGASQILSRFCEEAAPVLSEKHGGKFLVNDGGSFRVRFEDGDPETAHRNACTFGEDLAELYRLAVGGSLTVAEPVPWSGSSSFQTVNDEASKKLRRAKSHRTGAIAEPHMPYVALCASCGVALANKHGRLADEPVSVRSRYLCPDCQTKAAERTTAREDFLGEFIRAVVGDANADKYTPPPDADTVGRYDLRGTQYVAYLIADGNGMGSVFGSCDENQITSLSKALTPLSRQSLAETARLLNGKFPEQKVDGKQVIPILPLILGGDDVFALLPAPYALDVARRFCLRYEEKMEKLVHDRLKLSVPPPTISAAVVICKSKYPYALAHRRGEDLLKEAKQLGKGIAAAHQEHHSTVSFEVILGNRLGRTVESEGLKDAGVQRSMKPYWVVKDAPSLSKHATGAGLDLAQLLALRLALKDLPNKRLSELRDRFADLGPDIDRTNREARLEDWSKNVSRLCSRCGARVGSRVREALEVLGQSPVTGTSHFWRELRRKATPLLAHGMPDLLEVWDFAQDLDHKPEDYEPEETEL